MTLARCPHGHRPGMHCADCEMDEARETIAQLRAERDALRNEMDLHRWRSPDDQMPLGAFVFAEYTQGTVAGFINHGERRSNIKRWKLINDYDTGPMTATPDPRDAEIA